VMTISDQLLITGGITGDHWLSDEASDEPA
jgi:hypothetical protein